MTPKVPHWAKCEVSYAEAMAIKALSTSSANENQQKIFMNWLITRASNVLSLAWDEGSERASSFEAGRRYVGLKVHEVVAMDSEFYKQKGAV